MPGCGFTGGEIGIALGLTALIFFLVGAGLALVVVTAPPKVGQ